MSITRLSNQEILSAAEVIIDNMHAGSREQDWERYSLHMLPEHITKEHQAEVEQQWRESPILTTLSDNRELLGIFRQENRVMVSWKLWSSNSNDDLLELLWLTERDNDIKACGNRIF